MIEYVIRIPEYLEVLKTRERSNNFPSKRKRKLDIQHAISVYVAKSTSISAGGTDV